jgi:hypothetical protein
VGILPKEIHDVVGPYLARLDEKLKNGGAINGDAIKGDAGVCTGNGWRFDYGPREACLDLEGFPTGIAATSWAKRDSEHQLQDVNAKRSAQRVAADASGGR